jgi:hypothetical protein
MAHWFMGVLGAIAALVGLFMAAGARDFGISFFGFALMAWGVLFAWWMIKTAYAEASEAAGD